MWQCSQVTRVPTATYWERKTPTHCFLHDLAWSLRVDRKWCPSSTGSAPPTNAFVIQIPHVRVGALTAKSDHDATTSSSLCCGSEWVLDFFVVQTIRNNRRKPKKMWQVYEYSVTLCRICTCCLDERFYCESLWILYIKYICIFNYTIYRLVYKV